MKTSVLLTADGTYPHYGGGVSTWCHQLVARLAEIDFHLLSIVHSPQKAQLYQLPANVRSLDTLALWGHEEPGYRQGPFSEAYGRTLLTTEERIAQDFVPAFSTVVRSVFAGFNSDPIAMGEALFTLHCYFERFDYATTMTSTLAWETFKACSSQSTILTLEDATTCMRWLVRYLAIVARPYARTGTVHASMAGLAAIPGVLSKIRNGSHFVISEHGIHLRELYVALSKMNASEPCRRFLLGWNQAIVGMNYRYADHVTCLGAFNRKWQIAFGADPAKIEFVPNGVDPLCFFPAPKPPSTQPTVLTLARIFRLKGIDVLLRAAVIVREHVPNVRFRILGAVADPEYYAECREIVAQFRLEPTVAFDITSEPEKELRMADVYCLSSLSEGLPFTVLEAMFSGCPVVATDVGNVAETLSGAGLVVSPNNPEELARALLSVLDGPGAPTLRDALAERGLERARRHYTIESAMRPILAQYEKATLCPEARQTA